MGADPPSPSQNAHKVPPPWLIAMQRYGPPPSYPNLKIPGLNSPIPEVGAGCWGWPWVLEGCWVGSGCCVLGECCRGRGCWGSDGCWVGGVLGGVWVLGADGVLQGGFGCWGDIWGP